MKNKTHLFYGIIIGILLCACVGSNSNKTLSEVHEVYWNGEWTTIGTYENESEEPDLPSADHTTPNALVKMGWTIIDVEFRDSRDIVHYWIGK